MRRKTETEVRRFSSFELVARFTTNWEQQVDAPPSGAKVQNVAHPGRGWRGRLGWGGQGGRWGGTVDPGDPADPQAYASLISVALGGGNRMVKHYVKGN